MIVQSNINAFGANAMAGCGAYSKLEGFAFLPVNCFSLALSTFISQNIGANKLARVKKGIRFGLVCSPLLAEAVGLCIFLFAPVLIAAFNNEPDVLAYGVADARTVSLFYCLLAFSHCGAGIMRGMGKPVVPTLDYPDPEIPPISRIAGVDLTTEGVVTISRVLALAQQFLDGSDSDVSWLGKKDGASLIAKELFENATDINFFVGKAINPAHQNPDLPITFGIKIQLIENLSKCLERMGKRIKVSYF